MATAASIDRVTFDGADDRVSRCRCAGRWCRNQTYVWDTIRISSRVDGYRYPVTGYANGEITLEGVWLDVAELRVMLAWWLPTAVADEQPLALVRDRQTPIELETARAAADAVREHDGTDEGIAAARRRATEIDAQILDSMPRWVRRTAQCRQRIYRRSDGSIEGLSTSDRLGGQWVTSVAESHVIGMLKPRGISIGWSPLTRRELRVIRAMMFGHRTFTASGTGTFTSLNGQTRITATVDEAGRTTLTEEPIE